VSNVFISYRREDSAPYAGRICDRLEAAFGRQHVFMDVQDIHPGADFADAIEKTVGACDVLIAVIGPRWAELLRSDRGEQDFVEHEIVSAMNRKVTVIPVLVGGAIMPSERELPSRLAPLARRQAISMRDAGFDQDASELVHSVRLSSGRGASAKRLVYGVVAAGILISVIGSIFLVTRSRNEASIGGVWIVHMQKPGQRPFNIRLRFEQAGNILAGQVDYPTGSGAIEEGKIHGRGIEFVTRHVPQFETEPAKTMFRGVLRGREIDLTMISGDGAITKGVARKTDGG
jgi:hypothetical protein